MAEVLAVVALAVVRRRLVATQTLVGTVVRDTPLASSPPLLP